MQYELDVLDDAIPQDQKTTRYLPCDLTLDEQRERGELLANISNEIDTLEEEAKRVAGEFKTSILEAKGRYGTVKTAVLTRREHREVICTEYFNTKRGEAYTMRDDLGTIVDARVMTDRERQLHLPTIEVPTDSNGHEEAQAGAADGNGKIVEPENPSASVSTPSPLKDEVAKKRGRAARASN